MGAFRKHWLTWSTSRHSVAEDAPADVRDTSGDDSIESLSDGRRVLVRHVRPEDKLMLQQGFDALSEQSRVFRFCTPKRELSAQELCYLTELDGVNHVALGALLLDEHGTSQGAGIARYVRLVAEPSVAEAAVAVADALQGKGLGRTLLTRLGQVAARHGIERFRCLVLEENYAMLALLRSLDPALMVLKSGAGAREVELRVPGSTVNDWSMHELAGRFRGRSASSSWSGT
jgi:GNAT superfamily N-acetyltransferase